METRALQLPSDSLEVRVAWFAACVSVVLAGVALVPSLPLRAIALSAGTAAAAVLSPTYLRRATPVSTVVITVLAAFLSTSTVFRLSGLAWTAGVTASQAGGSARPSAWLLTTTSWCLAVGLLATGNLVVREGLRAGCLRGRAYLLARLLPIVACAGFLVVGLCQVGAGRTLSVLHNIAAVTAMGTFVVGMLGSVWLPDLSRALRTYSAVAAVVAFGAWLPTGLRFLGVTEASPISTLHMELLVFALSFGWLAWLAHEWGEANAGAV